MPSNMKRAKEYTGDVEHQHQTSESGVRTTGRVKKPKTVFDPSDNYLSRAQRSASAIAASVAASPPENIPTVVSIPVNATPNNLNISSITVDDSNINTSVTNNNNIGETPIVDYGKGFDTCMKCLQTEAKRGQGFKSRFLQCKTCIKKWHINCLPVQFECYRLARDKYKCEICRTCVVCTRSKSLSALPKNKELFMCTLCVDAYHVDCHKPSITKSQVSDGYFKCSKCGSAPPDIVGARGKKRSKTPDAKSGSKSDKSTSLPAISAIVTALPMLPPKQNQEQEEIKLATDIKSIKKWTVDNVVSFFTKYHPNEAYVFKKHEIDGASLLLLRRSQILKRFKLKMGPSLRIFETIIVLQTQQDNIMNAWND